MNYKKLELLLDKNEMKPYQLSLAIGVPTSTLSSWKNGNYTPKVAKIKKIADFFGVTVDYFVD